MLNWILWNGTGSFGVFFYIETVDLYWTELCEIELFIWIKMDFTLITYNGWCAIKPNQTKSNQSFFQLCFLIYRIYITSRIWDLVHYRYFPCTLVYIFLVSCSSVVIFFGCFFFFSELFRVSYNKDSSNIYSFDEISAAVFGFEKFSRSSGALFSHFFSFVSACLMVSASNIPMYL